MYLHHISYTSIPYFLHISQWIFIPNQSCCLLYSFWTNLLHLHMIYILFSFSTHSTFTVFLGLINVFILLVLIACYCAAIIKASVALFKHPYLSDSQRSSLALPIVCLINCPCKCFCIHCVFRSFFFLILESFSTLFGLFSSFCSLIDVSYIMS